MREYRTKTIYGDFYENEGNPLVVVIGGSRPGLPAPLDRGFVDYLRANFNVLLLAYFGAGELPESLERVPMEYFVGAVSAVVGEYGIDPDQVIVVGQSKGGEAALLLTNYLESAATIALVPSCYVFQGLPSAFSREGFAKRKSSWSFGGRDLPYIEFYFDRETVRDMEKKNYRRCYERSIEKNDHEEAWINVDRYEGGILLISEENDVYWPSRTMAKRLIERSANRGNMRHITMELPGHYLMNYRESVEEIVGYLEEISSAYRTR